MCETVPLASIRERLRDLNTKGYYLLVALSFLYGRTSGNLRALKFALCLTAFVAVLPIQDFADKRWLLEVIRWFKIIGLTVALFSTIYWVVFVAEGGP